MGEIFNKLIVFLIIPLILSIGIAPALPQVIAQTDAETQCREEVSLRYHNW